MENRTNIRRKVFNIKKRLIKQESRFVKFSSYCVIAITAIFMINCLQLTSLSFAQEKKVQKEPIVITSDRLTADNKAKTALFEGSVVAKKGNITMFADVMKVYYSEDKDGSNVKKIEAEGNVKLIRENRVVTSRFATYFSEPEEKIVFTGEPMASEEQNVVTGTKMIYFVKDDRSIVENSKVLLIERKDEK